jgi:hypothetical protein
MALIGMRRVSFFEKSGSLAIPIHHGKVMLILEVSAFEQIV